MLRNNEQLFTKGKVNIGEYSPQLHLGNIYQCSLSLSHIIVFV